jgi:hypothetical protein
MAESVTEVPGATVPVELEVVVVVVVVCAPLLRMNVPELVA